MFFKWMFALVSLSLLVSCSYFFGDKKENNNVYHLSISEKAGVSCLKDNSELLRAYFNRERDDAQIVFELAQMKKCLRDAIDLFVRHTKGSQGDVYSVEEIHNFLSSAFDTYDFPLAVMGEAVRLKDSLLGGTPYSISKDEVRLLPAYIDFLYDALARHAKDRHLLLLQKVDGAEPSGAVKYVQDGDWNDFTQAAQRLMATMNGFQQLPRKSSGTFDFEGLTRLLGYFVDGQDVSKWAETFDLVNSLQSMISTGRRDTADIQKVPFIITNLTELYIGYVEFQRFLRDDVFFQDLSAIFTFPGLVNRIIAAPESFEDHRLEVLSDIHEHVFHVLEMTTTHAPAQKLPLSYLSELIDTFHRINSFPSYIQPETLRAMMPQFFGFWLAPGDCDRRVCVDDRHISVENIRVLQRFVAEWRERQVWINSTVPRGTSLTPKYMSGFLTQRLAGNSNMNSFQEALDVVNHVHWEDFVVIGEKKFNYKDLVIFNKIYTLTQLFLRPFNRNFEQPRVMNYYLTQDQTQTFYDWLRPLALELKLADPRSRKSGHQAFTESNLFSSIATEPDKMNFGEVIEYIEIAISTSQRSVSIMDQTLGRRQFTDPLQKRKAEMSLAFKECRLPKIDVFGYEMLEAQCFRKVFAEKHEELLFSTLPRLKSYLRRNEDRRRWVLNYLERAGRQGVISDELVETDAFRLMGAIIQYAESLFLRYDVDENDVITTEEMKRALAHIVPNIRSLIQAALPASQAKLLYNLIPNFEEVLITYIVKHKSLPWLMTSVDSLTSTIGVAQLTKFKYEAELTPSFLAKDVRVHREDIVLVISALSSFSRTNRIKALRKIFYDNELIFDQTISELQNPVLGELTAQLQCSTAYEFPVRQWLINNQASYWKETLKYFEISTGKFKIPFTDTEIGIDTKLNSKDLPETGWFGGWEGEVTYRLIELVYKDPTVSAYCLLPLIEGIHAISPDQDTVVDRNVCGRGTGCQNVRRARNPY